MELTQQLKAFGAMVAVCLGASPAWADTRFTYTSDPLDWESSKLYGDPYVLGDDVSPVFTLSFILPGNWTALLSPATFFMPAAPQIGVTNYTDPYTFMPNASNKVTVGLNGEVTDWNFSYAFDPIVTPNTDPVEKLVNRRIKIFSKNGETTCDCDVLQERFNTATYLSGHVPFLIGPVEINYRDGTGPGNWSVAAISAIPEPSTYGMLLGGLAMIGYAARRKPSKPHAMGRLLETA